MNSFMRKGFVKEMVNLVVLYYIQLIKYVPTHYWCININSFKEKTQEYFIERKTIFLSRGGVSKIQNTYYHGIFRQVFYKESFKIKGGG